MIKDYIVKDIHVGEALRLWCKRNNLTRQNIADLMKLPKSNIDRVLFKPSIETSKLIELSRKLNHNFFAEFWSETNYDDLKKKDDFIEIPPKTINIGVEIGQYLAKKHITQNQLASALGITRPVVSKLVKKESIDTDKLVAISNILGHDFFRMFYYVERIEALEPSPAPTFFKDSSEDFKIFLTILKRNEKLAAENAQLKEALRDIYSQIQKFKEANGISKDNWDSFVKKEGVDIMNMATFLYIEENIKKILDESDQADSSNKQEKDK